MFCGALVAFALLLVHSGPALAVAPTNDDFDNATAVTALPFTDSQDVSEATRAADDPPTGSWPNVWYEYTPAGDTSLEVTTAGSNTDTSVCVYAGTRGALSEVACSPDGFDSHFFADLKGGVTYHLMVDITSACCDQSLTLTLTDRTVANDDFDSSALIGSLPYQDSRDVLRASSASDDPWCLQNSTNTVWYRYTPAADVTVAADTAGSDYDTRLCVYYGARGALNEVAANENANGTLFAALSVNLQANTTYWFMVATNQPDAASLAFSLQETTPLPTAAGDDFDSAIPISATPFSDTLDVSTATAAADDPDCYGTHASVWYALTPTVSGTATISTAGSDYDTALGVYTGSRGTLSQIGCDDNSDGLSSQVSFQATVGTTYYVLVVAAHGVLPGTLQLAASVTPPPPALTVTMTYASPATVDEQTGTAVVNGTIKCSRSAKATVTVSIGQTLGNSPVRTGVGKTTVACTTKVATAFVVTVQSTSSPGLSDGPASIRLLAEALGTKKVVSGDLQLVKKLK